MFKVNIFQSKTFHAKFFIVKLLGRLEFKVKRSYLAVFEPKMLRFKKYDKDLLQDITNFYDILRALCFCTKNINMQSYTKFYNSFKVFFCKFLSFFEPFQP